MLAVAAPVLVTVLAEVILVMTERAGWLDAPVPLIGPFLDAIRSGIGETAYPWVAGMTIGVALGMFLWRTAAAADRRIAQRRSETLWLLGERMDTLAQRFGRGKGAPFDENAVATQLFDHLLPDLLALETDLETFRLKLPKVPDAANDVRRVEIYQTWLRMLAPSVRLGHLKQARRAAREIEKSINAPVD